MYEFISKNPAYMPTKKENLVMKSHIERQSRIEKWAKFENINNELTKGISAV